MKTKHAQGNRLIHPRRVPAVRIEAKVQAGVQAPGEGRALVSAGSGPAANGTATGLLIPAFNATIPTSFGGNFEGAEDMIKEMVKLGLLTENSGANSLGELVEQGLEAMAPRGSGLYDFENQFGEHLIHIHVHEQGMAATIYGDCHAWRMRIKPIIAALEPEAALWAMWEINHSLVQGPWFWDDIIGFCDSDLESDDDPDLEANEGTPAGDAEKAKRDTHMQEGHVWLKELLKKQQLIPRKKVQRPEKFGRHCDEKLVGLLLEFADANKGVDKLDGGQAIMVTTWDKDCYINHSHDYIEQSIHNGNLDSPQGSPFDFGADNITELYDKIKRVSRFLAAAEALEEWSNKYNKRLINILK